MGDRCSFTIYAPSAEAERMAEDIGLCANVDDVGYDEDTVQEQTELYTQLYDGEANYAHSSEVSDWAQEGLSFFGHHSGGGEYSAGQFVAHGGELWDVRTTEDDDRPMVPVNEDGEVCPEALQEARQYWVMLRTVKALFGIPVKAPNNPAAPWEWKDKEVKL